MAADYVSIIVPTYNRASEIQRCLNSLVSQTYKRFEVLICDDGSTDATSEIVKSFQNQLSIRYFWAPNWGGPARPRNKGIVEAAYDWICFLDSDDWWYPNKLEECIPYTENYDLIYHDLDIHTSSGMQETKKCRALTKPPLRDLVINGNGLLNSGVMVKKYWLNKAGCFSEDRKLIAVEDADMWINVAMLTEKFYYLQKSLGAYWSGEVGFNISNSEKQLQRQIYLLMQYKKKLSLSDQSLLEYRIALSQAEMLKNKGFFNDALRYYFQAVKKGLVLRSIKALLMGLWVCCLLVKQLKDKNLKRVN